MTGQAAADLSAMVRAARGGNEAAFRLLYREVQPGLLRYLRGLVPVQDAEDIAAEAWLQIARDIRTFRDDGAGGFRGWAATIARHRALDHIRRAQRRPVAGLSSDVLVDLPDRTDTAEQAITHTMTNATIALIATLPRDQAEAVLLRVVMGLDAQAVAAVMGKRPGAVRTAVWRGLRKLGERLDQTGDRQVAATGVTSAGERAPRKTS
ncbi:RNA polymerase sigma factor [Actinophytocola algeriensis]|uniref:RNA polymerase sigma-70 factor (ECF subfamily) n=1 Tax=Actinophytocola algeriensis TaxID=1768010 RepID=A0A7W7VEU5_9PSEU|nr:RNA polymerase sigma factor [Actinophytocola algeriensis]MBB4907484.1 RNA polymerase sigma-70 factor (ECF subfamily) [Actinophytocola algeriensis]MBE1479514.1 RNA polymerase sigma-70 factor (ECF subfamily) [Actinophytocola algeriensis]